MKRSSVFRLLLFILMLSVLLTGCNQRSKENSSKVKSYSSADTLIPSGDNSINFQFDESQSQFTVSDSRNGKTWSNVMTDEYYREELINQQLIDNKRQLFTLTYCAPDDSVVSVRNVEDTVTAKYREAGGKVVGQYELTDVNISFELVFEVKDNTVTVTVPSDKIKEKDNLIVTLDLLPFLGASRDDENGYIFYPDGCGTLYEFKERPEVFKQPYKMQIFGNYFYEYQEYLDDTASGIKWAMLPVFGVKQGDGAVMGVITKGQSDVSVILAPSGYIYKANRIYPTFHYRYGYSTETVNEEEIILFQKSRSKSDFQVQYTFLSGNNANYSGMARTYREYLLKNKLLKKSEYSTSLVLDLLVSVKKPMLLWEQSVIASGFEGGLDILQSLKKQSVTNVKLNLLGWQSGGYNVYPSHFPVNGSAGGAKGLKNLIGKASGLSSVVSVNDDFFHADEGRSGYSKHDDLASSVKNEAYTNKTKDSFLLDFRNAFDVFTGSWIKKAKDTEIDAVNLDMIGRLLYENGSKSSSLRRGEAAYTAEQMLKSAKENFSVLSAGGGNAYTLVFADFLYDIPQTSSKDFLFDRDVPFFQMVVHGYIPYIAEIPGNLSDDYNKTVLRWIEYGYIPYYSVSQKDASILKDCYSKGVFVSKFTDWESQITKTVSQTFLELSSIKDQPIISHELLENGLVSVVYENGRQILVNYSDGDISLNGITVKAKNYKIN